ncbi:MAG TPA: D-glycero-beta-D-manno-heptose 1,7-bisphosphate 7-phosphatase [Pyrinomonadaceae bacterium]|nr:D-glycero-beta-D-manno-heptose 1,7-bisphosphate 7-phosphatase [Pyrinomonadaceae bacterium]
MKNSAVFIDRDGTLIEEANYLVRPEQLKLFPFAAEAIRLLNENGFLVLLITNQSGIGRGFFDENALREIHEKLDSDLAEQNAKIDQIYFCPHSPNDDCDCRKPKTGMIRQATGDFSIDLENSWTIGDKTIDVETGFNAGTKTALVLTGYGIAEKEKLNEKPDLVAENLLEAAKIICLPKNRNFK